VQYIGELGDQDNNWGVYPHNPSAVLTLMSLIALLSLQNMDADHLHIVIIIISPLGKR